MPDAQDHVLHEGADEARRYLVRTYDDGHVELIIRPHDADRWSPPVQLEAQSVAEVPC